VDLRGKRKMNVVDITKKHTVTTTQDYPYLIANYGLKILTMPNQIQVSHDFISVTVMHRDFETKAHALRHAIDEVVKKIRLKRANQSWVDV
jgi:hypothetical protein